MCRWTLGNVPNSRQSLKEPLSPQFCGLRWVQAHLWERGAGCTAVPIPQGILSVLSSLPSHTDSALCRVCGTSCPHWNTTWASHPCCPRGSFCREGIQDGFGDQKEQEEKLFLPECHRDVCCSLGAGMGWRGLSQLSAWLPASIFPATTQENQCD